MLKFLKKKKKKVLAYTVKRVLLNGNDSPVSIDD